MLCPLKVLRRTKNRGRNRFNRIFRQQYPYLSSQLCDFFALLVLEPSLPCRLSYA